VSVAELEHRFNDVLPVLAEAESAEAEDLEAGCNVLLHAMLELANRNPSAS